MVIENISNAVSFLPAELVGRIDFLITILQALGWFIIFWVIFNIISAIMNRKKNKEIKKINENLEDIKKLLKRKK